MSVVPSQSFRSVDGSPLHCSAVVRSLAAAAKSARLNEDGRPKLHWHSLRHTAAALWIASQAEAEYVSRQLGHANSTITRNVYGHVFDRTRQSCALAARGCVPGYTAAYAAAPSTRGWRKPVRRRELRPLTRDRRARAFCSSPAWNGSNRTPCVNDRA